MHVSYHLYTLPETNIAPENGWLGYNRFLLGPSLFSGAFAVSSRDGYFLSTLASMRQCALQREGRSFARASRIPRRFRCNHRWWARSWWESKGTPHQNAKPPDPPPQKVRPLSIGCFLTIIVQVSFNDPLIRLSYFAQVLRGVWGG